MKRDKPRLHLVKGERDPNRFHSDLDWYFNCADSVCGFRSSMGGHQAILEGIAGGAFANESNHHNEPETGWPGGETGFGRVRKIWSRLSQLTHTQQQLLELWYTEKPERVAALGVTEDDVQAAHVAYRATGAVREAG